MREHERGEPLDATARAAECDARYSERDVMWSGRPDGRLVAEVADLTPGRALDAGCGEGADAIWLARRGWTVTAIDISDVAVSRAGGSRGGRCDGRVGLRGRPADTVPGPLVRSRVDAVPGSAQGRWRGRRADVARHGEGWRVAARRPQLPLALPCLDAHFRGTLRSDPALGSAELFGERNDDAIGTAEVAEAVEILVLRHLTDEVGAVSPHARDDVVDVVDREHDTT